MMNKKTMWEYSRFEFRFRNFYELNEELNRIGHEGWDIIYYTEKESTKLNGEMKANILMKRFKNDINTSN